MKALLYSRFLLPLLFLSCSIADAPKRAPVNTLPEGTEGIVLVSGSGQTVTAGAELPDALKVAAFAKDGSPLAKATVEFTVVEGNATLAASSTETDTDGVASTTATVGTVAGNVQIRARLLPDPYEDEYRSVPFDISVTRDDPSGLSFVKSKTGINICSTYTWKIRLTDQFGNGVPGTVLTVTPTTVKVNGSAAVANITTDDSGEISFSVAAPTSPGNGSINVTGPGGIEATLNITAVYGLKISSDRNPVLTLGTNESDNITFTFSDGCGVYANYDFFMRYSNNPDNTNIDFNVSPNFKTNGSGQYVLDTQKHPPLYYWRIGVERGSEQVTYLQTVIWQ